METLNSDVDEPTGSAEALVHELFAWNAYLTTRYSSLSHSDATDASSRLLACLQGIESHAGAKALLRTELRLGTIKGYDFFRAMHDRLDGGDQSGHIPRQADRISRRACWHTWAKLAFSLAPELQHEHSERVWQHTLVRAWRAGVVSDSEMLRICKWASPEVWRFGMRIILGEHGPVRARQDPLPRQLRVLLKARPLDSTQIENIWYLRDMAQGGPRRPRDPSAERRWAVLLKMAPVWCERLQTAIATWNLIHGNDGAVDKDELAFLTIAMGDAPDKSIVMEIPEDSFFDAMAQ